MARIPLQVASRSLDTGNVVSYPNGGEIGRSLQGAGDELSQVADHFRAVKDQQDRFDAGVVDDELRQRIAQTEDDAARNAPADGSGIHDSVYGQMDVNGRAVRPGAFDTLFDEYAQKVPESQRSRFIESKEAMRLAGSNRLASVQYASRQAYEQVELTKSQDTLLNGILTSDPNDTETFEAFKQNGLDRIAASGMSALDKEKAAYNWNQSATKGLFQSMLEKDPAFAGKAREALGLSAPAQTGGGAVNTVVDRIIGVESGGSATAKNPNSSASGIGQFLDSTWVEIIRQHRPDIAEGKSAAQIIALKSDPVLGRQMVAALTQDNADYLTNRGIATTPGNLYLAHFLGSAGAVNVLKADPNASIASVVGQDVVRANNFLTGKTVADTIAWSDKKMGGAGGGGQADPRFAGLDPDARLTLANQADVQYRQQQTAAVATEKASYTAYKDRFELGIVAGRVTDPALITGDKTLNDGDKASLLRSFNEQNKGAIQLQTDLTALNGNSLTLDPYASDDKKRADNLYSGAADGVSAEQAGSIATAIIQQTHVVPQPIVNDMRRGLSSTNPAQVIAAAQTAQKISAYDPAALGRRDGGSEVQKAADDFSYYVNKLNLAPEEAARRMIENADPAKQRDRKALEPAAKEFVKTLADENLASDFKDSWFSSAPSLGITPAQELGIKADFIAIAEDQFYAKNGDPALAKNAAIEQMKALYGVSTLAGPNVLMKHPPERYWPKSVYQSQDGLGAVQHGGGAQGPVPNLISSTGEPSLDYARKQLESDISSFSGRGSAGPTGKFDGQLQPGNIDLAARPIVKNADGTISTVRSMSFAETDGGPEILIPTVSPDGKILSNKEAIDLYHQTGQSLGVFDTPDHADAYAEALHEAQDQFYRGDLHIDMSTVRLVSTPETDAMIKRGELPGYAVLYTDANGNYQTIPGKLWRPDVTAASEAQKAKDAADQATLTESARQKDLQTISGHDRDFSMDNMLNGNTDAYTPEKRSQFLEQERKAQPGGNIPANLPKAAR